MKTLKIKLRDDLINFIKQIPNPNQFVTEALELFICKKQHNNRINAEKTLYLFNAGKHLQAEIDKQKLNIQEAERETVKIEKRMQETRAFMQTYTKIIQGKFTVEKQDYAGYRAVATRPDGTLLVVTQNRTSPKDAKTSAILKAKQIFPRHAKNYGKLKTKQRIAEKRLQAERAKLYDMEKNLKTLIKAFLKER